MTTIETTPMAYRPEQAAKALNCSRDTIFRLLATGELKGFRVGAARFISADELREFIRAREAQA